MKRLLSFGTLTRDAICFEHINATIFNEYYTQSSKENSNPQPKVPQGINPKNEIIRRNNDSNVKNYVNKK